VAKQSTVNTSKPAANPGLVVAESPLFRETAAKYAKPGSAVLARYIEFVKTKKENPIALFGSPKTDKKNPDGTPMSQEVPGIRHAHLTHDVSVFYTISGSNPSVLRVYAMLSHDEAGTGQPTNYKVQKSVGRRMANQNFSI
jgi:hypothetical protein